jgi:hypothetical protein
MRKSILALAAIAVFAARAEAAERTFSVHAGPEDSRTWAEVSATVGEIVKGDRAAKTAVNPAIGTVSVAGASAGALDEAARYVEEANRILDRQATVEVAFVDSRDVDADLVEIGARAAAKDPDDFSRFAVLHDTDLRATTRNLTERRGAVVAQMMTAVVKNTRSVTVELVRQRDYLPLVTVACAKEPCPSVAARPSDQSAPEMVLVLIPRVLDDDKVVLNYKVRMSGTYAPYPMMTSATAAFAPGDVLARWWKDADGKGHVMLVAARSVAPKNEERPPSPANAASPIPGTQE